MRKNFLLLGLVAGAAGPATASVQGRIDSERSPSPRWYVPHHLLGQYAGGQGLATVGAGYTALHRRVDLDVLAGYVPKRYSITPMGIFTAKVTYSPWNLTLGASSWRVRPLTVGGLVSYTASSGFNKTHDEKYDRGYYWWSAHTRLGAFVGGRVAYQLPPRGRRLPHTLSLYYELGTNELYAVSFLSNIGALPLTDILTLGLGVKLDLW
jgi:hypothetical protein